MEPPPPPYNPHAIAPDTSVMGVQPPPPPYNPNAPVATSIPMAQPVAMPTNSYDPNNPLYQRKQSDDCCPDCVVS
jgi:hypothetical protein